MPIKNRPVFIKIKIPSPFTSLSAGIFFVFFCIIVVPANYQYTGTIYSWLYIGISLILMFFGLFIGSKRLYFKPDLVYVSSDFKTIKKILSTATALAVIGVVLRLYDKLVLRGASPFLNMVENREMLMESGTNIFSIISSFLYPLVLFLPFFFLLYRSAGGKKWHYSITVIVLSAFPIFDGILLGSRSVMMIWLLLAVLYIYSFGYFKIRPRYLILLIIGTIAFFIFNGYIFDARTRQIGINPIESTQLSVYANFLPLSDDMKAYLSSTNNILLYYFLVGIINFLQYMAHGLFELLYLIDNFNIENIYFGQQNFAVVMKFFYKILNIPFSFAENQEYLVRTGIYNTLFGPVYYDFAFLGIVFIFILGFIIGKTAKYISKKKSFMLVPIYFYFLLLLFFSLIVNLITFAQGIYNLTSFAMLYLLVILFILKKRLHNEKGINTRLVHRLCRRRKMH